MNVAVGLIVYRRYHYLDEAIKSIAVQSERPDEIIIITDDVEKANELIKKHNISNVKIYEEPRQPLPPKYTLLAELTKAEYILPLEDDDLFKPNKIENIKEIIKHKKYPLIKHATDFIDIHSNLLGEVFFQPREEFEIDINNLMYRCKKFSCHTWPSTFVIKRDILEKYKEELLRLKLLADLAIFVFALQEGKVLYYPQRLSLYRIGSGTSTFGNISDFESFIKEINKYTCTLNKYAHDGFYLFNSTKYKSVKKYIYYYHLKHLYWIYYYNDVFTCDFMYDVKYTDLMSAMLRSIWLGVYPFKILLRRLVITALSPLIGRRRLAKWYLKRNYNRRINTK